MWPLQCWISRNLTSDAASLRAASRFEDEDLPEPHGRRADAAIPAVPSAASLLRWAATTVWPKAAQAAVAQARLMLLCLCAPVPAR